MSQRMMIGLCQLNSSDQVDQNLDKAKEMIQEAAKRGAQIISLPENFNYVGLNESAMAEDIPGGKTFTALSNLAKQEQIWIHGGSIYETSRDERPYNTTMVISPTGELVAKYRKIHPFDAIIQSGRAVRESDRIQPGKDIVTLDTSMFGRWGFSICYDLRFPELFRIMALDGAQIMFCPADFTLHTGRDHWLELLKARAIENSCYLIAAGQIGNKPRFQSYGRSVVIDPWGIVLAQASDSEGVILAELDLDRVDQVRNQLFSLANRREDIYRIERQTK